MVGQLIMLRALTKTLFCFFAFFVPFHFIIVFDDQDLMFVMLSKHIKDSHGLKWHIRFITPLGDLLGTTSSQIGVGMCRINVLKWLNPNWVVIMSLVCQLQILCGILWAISNKIFILAVTVMSILSHYAASCTDRHDNWIGQEHGNNQFRGNLNWKKP